MNHAIDENTGCHDHFRIEFAQFDEMARLHDGQIGCHRHYWIEVPARAPIGKIAPAVSMPSLNQSDIGVQGALHNINSAIEFTRLLASGELGSGRSRSIECRNPASSSANPLGQSALRHDFQRDFAGAVLFFKRRGRGPGKAAYQFCHPARCKQSWQTGRTETRIVGDDREIPGIMVDQSGNQFLRLANNAKAAQKNDRAIPDAAEGLIEVANAFVDHEITGGFISLRFDPLPLAVARESLRES